MKKIWILISLICGGMLLSAQHEVLAKNTQPNNDYVVVYKNGKNIRTITNKKSVTYISDLTGDLGENENGIHKKAPNNSKAVYHYVLHNGKKRTKPNAKINLYVYSGTRKVHVTGLPIISNVTSNVNKKQYHKLTNPNHFE